MGVLWECVTANSLCTCTSAFPPSLAAQRGSGCLPLPPSACLLPPHRAPHSAGERLVQPLLGSGLLFPYFKTTLYLWMPLRHIGNCTTAEFYLGLGALVL